MCSIRGGIRNRTRTRKPPLTGRAGFDIVLPGTIPQGMTFRTMSYRALHGDGVVSNSSRSPGGRRRTGSVVTDIPASTNDHAARATLGRQRRARRPGPPEPHPTSWRRDSNRKDPEGQARCPPPQSSQMTSEPRSGSAARATLGRRRRARRPGPPEPHPTSWRRNSNRKNPEGQARCPPPQSSQMTSEPRSGSAARATLGRHRRPQEGRSSGTSGTAAATASVAAAIGYGHG